MWINEEFQNIGQGGILLRIAPCLVYSIALLAAHALALY